MCIRRRCAVKDAPPPTLWCLYTSENVLWWDSREGFSDVLIGIGGTCPHLKKWGASSTLWRTYSDEVGFDSTFTFLVCCMSKNKNAFKRGYFKRSFALQESVNVHLCVWGSKEWCNPGRAERGVAFYESLSVFWCLIACTFGVALSQLGKNGAVEMQQISSWNISLHKLLEVVRF